MTTARISNIESATTKDALVDFIESKGLSLNSGRERVSLTAVQDGYKTATVTFSDGATLKKALALPPADKILNGRHIGMDNGFDGFTVLSEGTELDVVALHGLNGHAFKTWEYHDEGGTRFMWLRDSLPEHIPDARILIYGYNANVLSDVSTGRIRTFADAFLERLRQMRNTDAARHRPLLVIAHSMGGLIIKQALIIASARADKCFDSILNSIRGVIFLGTPHRGGNGVDTATFFSNFLRAVNVDARTDLIRSLDPHSMILFDLTDDFRQLVEAKGIAIFTLFEGKKTTIGRWPAKHRVLIVEEQSAILGTARERKASVNADHSHLCKFEGPADESLAVIIRMIKELNSIIVPMITTRNASGQPYPPEGLKYTTLKPSHEDYPILVWGPYSYWALSYIDNRVALAILAYDSKGSLVKTWARGGTRYLDRISYENSKVTFFGQGGESVSFTLQELVVVQ